MRKGRIERVTAETTIRLALDLDGTGKNEIKINSGFMTHMLQLFAGHGRFDLFLDAEGDVFVDQHHLTEDLGIALGQAVREALGNKAGIRRYADIILPMDETLMLCAIDISGRAYLGFDVEMPSPKVGEFDTELVKEFFLGFVRSAGVTLHFRELAGENTHHIIEAMFKAFARVLAGAVSVDEKYRDEIPSTKGILE
ncbi:MAG: imidazoleglycerol-phosphate dehydratase HisB [Anaerovoracaceae bacterium]|jgi:imidazoleglycerol-phosphate dehydratase